MRTPVYTNRFEKDLKLMIKRGSDPATKKIISDPQGEMNALQRTIREAALKERSALFTGMRWKVPHGRKADEIHVGLDLRLQKFKAFDQTFSAAGALQAPDANRRSHPAVQAYVLD